ncbi:hypothetical protein J3R82DRAFT_2711 [Butyriboletus roseoflavus]|nr:hypothetical protein J3R82DRAFT_2711 [Butyriboletus roseoflavus]
MSRLETVVQASSHDRRISHRLQRIPCGRCYAVIEYDRGTEWSVINELVNVHWEACPGKLHARPAGMAHTPTSPPDTTIVLPQPIGSNQQSSSNLVAESVNSLNNTWISAGCERKRRTLDQRKLELEQDEYAKNVTTKSVVCGGCHKEISLDKRSKYYPGLWLKHKGKCPSIEKLERAKARSPQASCDVVISAFDGNGYGDVLQLSPTERNESHSTAATLQLVRHYDSEDPSSEDGEEDEGLLSQEPFPKIKTSALRRVNAALNSDFYRTQRLYNRSDVWAYRYATKDEINTNFFRGQEESYARLGGHPFTHLSLQTGSPCEIPRCVIKKRVEQAVSQPDSSNFRSTKELSKLGRDVTPHTQPWHTEAFPH